MKKVKAQLIGAAAAHENALNYKLLIFEIFNEQVEGQS